MVQRNVKEVCYTAASNRGVNLDEWGITWDEYKELDYFCRQYDRKRAEAAAMLTLRISTPQPATDASGNAEFMPHGSGGISDPVSAVAEKRDKLLRDIRMIETAAKTAGGDLSAYLLKNVTRKCGIQQIISEGCPCSERSLYRMRRLFFYTLYGLKNQ